MKNLIFLLLALPTLLFSQELDATVVINVEQLETKSKDRLKSFAMVVQDYLNNNRFSGDSWEFEKIQCNFNIFFIGGSETQYKAQVVVSSQRAIEGTKRKSLMLSVLDPDWTFPYEEGQAMYFNQTDFDPLLSFLDFYAYLILGLDSDSYDPNGGDPFFNKSLELAVRGATSKFKNGWELNSASFNRRAYIEELHNANFAQFRIDYCDYHYNGLDIYYNDKKGAQANMVKLITNLEKLGDQINPRSVLLKAFFKSKSSEIVEYLRDYADTSIFDTLIKLDRQNTSKYQAALDGE